MDKAYIKEIDILKGIGIYLVVLGHLSLPKEMLKFIYSFHMPLFFFVSGFVFQPKSNLEFFNNKFKRILVPFYIFSIISFLLYCVQNFPNINLTVLKNFLIGTVLGIANHEYLSWNIVLWFLPCLFFLNVLANFVYGFFRNYVKIVLLVFFLMSLFVLKDRNWTFLPFHMGSAMLMIPFFIAGSSFKKNYSNLAKVLLKNAWVTLLISISLIVIGIFVSYCNSLPPDVSVHLIGDVFFFYTGAFFTILGLLFFSRFITSKILIWLGFNSLLIMCIHLKLTEVASEVVRFIPFGDDYGIILTMLIILLCVPFVFLFNKYFPVAVGLKK